MTHYIQTVRSRALPGRQTEYHDWFLFTHIPAVLSLEGFESAELHRLVAPDDAPAEFLCIYQLETADLQATQAAMFAAGAAMVKSDAMDVKATRVDVYSSASA
ncbi:hypothetical protein ABIE21_002727 [Conyzicola nivalis]|uniref:EthD domain-containing protein n=1 Tax=Conyzicola nivalis TaxID=1477021 RepID=A0ABV2QQ71_9MICO